MKYKLHEISDGYYMLLNSETNVNVSSILVVTDDETKQITYFPSFSKEMAEKIMKGLDLVESMVTMKDGTMQ